MKNELVQCVHHCVLEANGDLLKKQSHDWKKVPLSWKAGGQFVYDSIMDLKYH